MELTSSTIAFLLACALVGGYLWNRGRWSKLSDEQLAGLASGPQWRRWKPALRELQRRGRDIEAPVAFVASRLLAPGEEEREAAYAALSGLSAEWDRHLTACGYKPSDDVSVSRTKLHPVLQHLDDLTKRSTLPHAQP